MLNYSANGHICTFAKYLSLFGMSDVQKIRCNRFASTLQRPCNRIANASTRTRDSAGLIVLSSYPIGRPSPKSRVKSGRDHRAQAGHGHCRETARLRLTPRRSANRLADDYAWAKGVFGASEQNCISFAKYLSRFWIQNVLTDCCPPKNS
jgi:hypothetical protein